MALGTIGPLLAADESFTHQIVETFATVAQTDYAWTEKVCGMIAARDGLLQIGFGFGKYVNRNVVDGYGGVSRGVEQWSVCASRALSVSPDDVDVGPLSYEVLEPLKRVRVSLAANEAQPIAFEVELEGIVPCFVEDREDRRGITGFRRTADQIRYHQTGIARGWVEVGGVRTEITPDTWIMTRDHSWGIRPGVGLPLTDLPPEPVDSEHMRILAVWNPLYFQNPDGSTYAFHQYYLQYAVPGFEEKRVQGHFEYADGRREAVAMIKPMLRFDPSNRRLLGGEFQLQMSDGTSRMLKAVPLGDTGFHLGAGLYHRLDGQNHGQYRGELHVSGEYFADCSLPSTVAVLNQFRDCMIEVSDSATGATGWGNCQTYVAGEWPEMGLSSR